MGTLNEGPDYWHEPQSRAEGRVSPTVLPCGAHTPLRQGSCQTAGKHRGPTATRAYLWFGGDGALRPGWRMLVTPQDDLCVSTSRWLKEGKGLLSGTRPENPKGRTR